MDFYTRKVEATKIVDKMLSEKKKRETIIYTLQTSYGFGEKFLDNRMKVLQDMIDNQNGKDDD